MPFQDLRDRLGSLHEAAPLMIQALMFYPEDSNARKRFYEVALADISVRRADSSGVHPTLAAITGEAHEGVARKASPLAVSGYAAGVVTLALVDIARRELATSLNRATFLMSCKWGKDEDEHWLNDLPVVVPRNEKHLKSSFRRFRRVGHLWAAQLLACGAGPGDNPGPTLESDCLRFVALAGYVAEKAMSVAIALPRQRTPSQPVIDPATAWRFRLPIQAEGSRASRFPLPTLPDGAIQALDRYRSH